MIRRDPIFKGCTRPAMLWGVPIVPFIGCMSVILLFGLWLSLLLLLAMIPAFIVMRLVVRSDDQQFRLLWLKAKCRLFKPNRNHYFWRASTYGPVEFKKRK